MTSTFSHKVYLLKRLFTLRQRHNSVDKQHLYFVKGNHFSNYTALLFVLVYTVLLEAQVNLRIHVNILNGDQF
jgi:hypothetical protein